MEMMSRREAQKNRRRISLSLINYKKILSLRGVHRDRQCVVVATGPSINQTDLSLIENHPFVLGVNAAYRLRSQFKYYFCSDSNFYFPNINEIHRLSPDYFFLSSHIRFRNDPRCVYLKVDEMSAAKQRAMARFQTNLLRTLSWGPTVILDLVLPTALWMGFTEIILLGTDYPLESYGHFYPEADHKVLLSGRINFRKEMLLAREGFRVLLSTLKERKQNVKIYNCSPLSELECFEKKTLSEVIATSRPFLSPDRSVLESPTHSI